MDVYVGVTRGTDISMGLGVCMVVYVGVTLGVGVGV